MAHARTSLIILFCIPCLRPAAFGQGALPLSGTYAFGQVSGEHGQTCSGNAIYSDRGTITFQPDGSLGFFDTQHVVCEDGTIADSSTSGSGTYVVGSDGKITFEPGAPDELHAWLRPDLRVLVAVGDNAGQQPNLIVATLLSSGLSNSVLFGQYHFAKFALENPGTGTRGEVWNGTVTFASPGSFTASYQRKSVASDGQTTFGSGSVNNGTFSVASDGQVALMGFPNSTMNGGVTSDGRFFFAADLAGQDAALIVGLRTSSTATNQLLDGEWRIGNIWAGFGPGPGLPVFCSGSYAADVDGTTASYTSQGVEVCEDPGSQGVSPDSGSGTYSISPNGALCLFEGGPCTPGAVDPSGTLAFAPDMVELGDIGLPVLLRLGELPTSYGMATPGTGGLAPLLKSTGGFAYLGNPAFGFQISQGLGGSSALLGLSAATWPGINVLGGTIWIDPAAIFYTKSALLSAGGGASIPLPIAIPTDPAIEGISVYAQALVFDGGAPAGFAMTAGLEIPLQR